MASPLHRFKADLFKALAHPARIRILELLRQGEQTVSELQADLGIDPSSVSQHLAVLRARDVLDGRKAGTSVYYRVTDPQLFTILDAAREIFETHVDGLQEVLNAQRAEEHQVGAARHARAARAGSTARRSPAPQTSR
jgi:DNA-binding transcriptional ArsR family regulator